MASQTLENLTTIAGATSLEMLRPLIGMDKDEIVATAEQLGTFPISIIPDQDCCQLFTPRHPATRVGRAEIEEAERALPLADMVEAAVASSAVEDFRFPVLTYSAAERALGGHHERDTIEMSQIEAILGEDATGLLEYQCKGIPKESLHLPGPDFIDRVAAASDRPIRVLTSLQALLNHGRLAGTGYVSILPVDQGIEHSAGASFAPNPLYFDPENIVKLAIDGGCNAVASTLGVLGAVARKYAHKIPFLLKFNHNEFLSYPNAYDQIRFASIKQAFEMGAMGVGATIYFGSEESKRQLQEVTDDVPAGPRAGDVHRPVVLSAQLRIQDERGRLPRRRRSDRPGQPPRRDDRSRHHQAEAAGEQRRIQRPQFRKDAQEGLLGAHERTIQST